MSSSLHQHSTFSKLDAFGMPKDMVARAQKLGLKALAITDHGNTSAHPKLEQACKGSGVKPIYGVELYLNTKQQHKNHITIIAKNTEGYRNLLKLSSMAYDKDHFYYLPCVDLEDVYDHKDGLIVLSGCLSGIPAELLLEDKIDEARAILVEMDEVFDDFYVEIQPFELEESKKITPLLIKLAESERIPLVATNDSHFILPEHAALQHFLAMIRRNKNYEDFSGTLSERCAMASEEQYYDWLVEYGVDIALQAIANQDKIADLVEPFELPKAEPVQISDEPEEVRYEKLVQLCREGWRFRKLKNTPEYVERVKYELEIIRSKGYIDYFLVVADMIIWAKEHNILVGPARGSAGGSLVSYLMRITEIDPIKFGLLFERFLDPSRTDPPDIDIDFQDDRREEVKEYLRQKYGAEKVANVAGYTMFHDKGLLDDIGRCYRIARSEIKKYKDSLIENGGDMKLEAIISELTQSHPQIPSNITSMLGQLRGYTVHAAGVIVSTRPLAHTTTMMGNTIALDKRDAEYMNLLKIDALSLSTLRVISHALKKIGMSVNELYALPLDIPEVLQGFQRGEMQGIFQYSGSTTKRVCVEAMKCYEIDASNADEVMRVVIDVNTLSRPASLGNGSTDRYIKNQHESIHPILDKHTADSRGQIIYQEQIMRALRDADISWADITAVRKIIQGKGDQNKLPIIRQKFIDHLVECGDNKELAAEVWGRLGDEGAYGFNFAHCVAYTMIAYYTMYLKTFHRTVFYWSNLMVDPEDKTLMREFEILSEGSLLPVRFGKSEADWSIEGDNLRAGYTTVKGIGAKSAAKLVALGDNDKKIAKGVRKKLEDVNAFDPDPVDSDYLGLNKMTKKLNTINNRNKISEFGDNNKHVIFGGKIIELHFKSLKEYYLKDGRDPETIPDKECDRYVNFRIADENSEVVCTVTRYRYAQSYELQLLFDTYTEGEVIILDGNWNSARNKVYINRISRI